MWVPKEPCIRLTHVFLSVCQMSTQFVESVLEILLVQSVCGHVAVGVCLCGGYVIDTCLSVCVSDVDAVC